MTYKSRKTVSQQLSAIGFVVGLHVVGVYFVASGLARQAVEQVVGPIETKIIEEDKPKQEELPPPPPKLQTPPPYVPPPDLDIAIEAPPPSTNTTAIAAVSNKPAPPPPPPKPDTEPRLDPKWRGNKIPDSAYPTASVRLCEQGDAVLTFLVQTDGRIGEVRLDKSTGFKRIDDFGTEYIQKNWRFLPATQNGQPIAAWKTMRIVFKINGCK